MKIGPYAIFPELPAVLLRNLLDAQKIRKSGIPRLPGDDATEVATAVLLHNAKEVLNAGQGHFVFMWPTDFGKAIRGALSTLPHSYLENLIELMIIDSSQRGKVSSCFSYRKKFHGFDMPYERADNLPWLMHSLSEYLRASNDPHLLDVHRESLQKLVTLWEDKHLQNGLIAENVTGDWMDTVMRPSSTYNNLCALYLMRLAREYGFATKHSPEEISQKILTTRLRDGYFIDYARTERRSVDATVITLYLELFDKELRQKLALNLQQSPETKPYLIRSAIEPYPLPIVSPVVRFSPHYHDGIWLHLGMMYLNGVKKLGWNIDEELIKIDALTMQYGNMVETLSPQGELFNSPFHATEYGLTMTAGQYLELVLV